MTDPCLAFEGTRRIASGDLPHVALKAKAAIDRGLRGTLLIFDGVTSQPIDVDFRGALKDILRRLPSPAEEAPHALDGEPRRPGRPKLGVVAREVTLLPRHWEWLNEQPGGASVALRKLVEEARRVNADKDRLRRARESVYRFASALAGNEPGFEDATRALFAGDRARFAHSISGWPADVRKHASKLADSAFA